jgi:hypothetical protein
VARKLAELPDGDRPILMSAAPPNAKGMESGDTVIYVIVEQKENVAEKTSVYEKRGVTNL